jgi:DNA uptake protein ComE-like DNA-binding protein
MGNQGLSHRIGLGMVAALVLLYSLLTYLEQEKEPTILSKITQDSLTKSFDNQLIPEINARDFRADNPATIKYNSPKFYHKDSTVSFKAKSHLPPSAVKKMIVLESADSAGLEQLPGIGPVLAARIIKYRNKLGGFYALEQVGEVYGLPDSVFERIKPLLQLGKNQVIQININEATEAELSKHPYIQWKMARQLIRYRAQHGDFKNKEDLNKIWDLDTMKIQKLLPYLQFVIDSSEQ